MTLSVLVLLASLAASHTAERVAAGTENAEKDITVIAVEIRHEGRVVSKPTIHAAIGIDAGIRQSVEVDGESIDLDVEIRIDRKKKQPGHFTGKFVYRIAGETVSVMESWRQDRRVEHVAGPFTIALALSAP